VTFDPRTIGALPTAQAGGRPAPMAPMPTSRYVLPQYEERTAYGFKRQDPYTKLFEDRIIFLGVQVDDASADDVMAQLLVLESQDPDRDITLYINSPGGSFTALTAIYDTMQYIKPEITTVCLGQASDLEIQANEIMRMREWLEDTLAHHSGRTKEQISTDIERDKILTAQAALDYGLVDQVLASRKEARPALGR
jgi:ATP-dependent Clp protease protease subunit